MSAYRIRKCPQCRAVFPGGELKPLRYGPGHYHQRGGSLRRCPRCGHVGFTQDFRVVGDEAARGYMADKRWKRQERVVAKTLNGHRVGPTGTLCALGDPEQVSVAEVGERSMEVLDHEWRKTGEILKAIGNPAPADQLLRNALHKLCDAGRVERDPMDKKQGATYRWRAKT